MNEQEAIELLKGMQNPLEDYADMVGAPAWATGYRYVYPDPEDYAIEEAITALEEKKNRRWIPVSERLPVGKEFEIKAGKRTLYRTVLVQTASHNIHAAYYNTSEQVWRDDTGIIRLNVVAWRLLPKEYIPE